MSVTQFPTKFKPEVVPIKVEEELLTPEQPISDDAQPLTLLQQNIETIKFMSIILQQVLNNATIDLQHKQLLILAQGAVQAMNTINNLAILVPEQINNEPERA